MKIIFLIILLEGLVSISVEILAIRRVTPFVGSNIINTSFIIGAFLLFLSLGYYKGGKVLKNHFAILGKNLLISQVFISIGLSYIFILNLYEYVSNSYLFISLFSIFIIGPIVYLLGQTIPILSNFFKDKSIGEINGIILFISTFGSFIGSMGTALLAINYLGVNNTIVLISFIVFIVNILIYIYSKKFIYIIGSSIVLFISVLINPKLFIKSNNYSDITVVEDVNKTKLYFVVNRSASSSLEHNTSKSGAWYIQKLDDYIEQNAKQNHPVDILVAGAGGFTLGLQDKINKYTFIDVDKDLQKIAQKYFIKRKINGTFIVSDIRSYLKSINKKYRYIISDVYTYRNSIPALLTTHEYMVDIKNRLTKDGEALFNIIHKSDYSTPFSRNIHKTIHSVFNCSIIPKKINSSKKTNVLYYCKPKYGNATVQYDDKIDLLSL